MQEELKSLQAAVEAVDTNRDALDRAKAKFDEAQKAYDAALATATDENTKFQARIAQSVPGLRAGKVI